MMFEDDDELEEEEENPKKEETPFLLVPGDLWIGGGINYNTLVLFLILNKVI